MLSTISNYVWPARQPLSNEQYAFQQAIKQGNVDGLGEFSVDKPLPNGEMPLHYAVREGQLGSIKFLLERGADPKALDRQGLSAIDHAVLMHNGTLEQMIGYKVGQDVQTVTDQIKSKGSNSHARHVLEAVKGLQKVDPDRLSPVCRAAYLGDEDDDFSGGLQEISGGMTPLHYAVLGGHLNIFKKMVDLGADPLVRSPFEETLLHYAAASGVSPDFMAELVQHGVDPNHQNAEGATALHYCAARNDLTTMEALVKLGADPRIVDYGNLSSLSLIGMGASQKDPLGISKAQVAIFALSMLWWASAFGLVRGDNANSYIIAGSLAISVCNDWCMLFNAWIKTGRKLS